MPLRLAFSSNAYLDVTVEQAIERIAGFGYAGIELLADVPHAWPAGLLEVQKESIRRALRANGLVVSNINAFMMNAIMVREKTPQELLVASVLKTDNQLNWIHWQ